MVNCYEGIYYYEGFSGCESKCDLKVYGNLVIATELDDNKGTSITNMAEVLATKVCKEFKIDFEKLIWIEHYVYKNRLGKIIEETFDKVSFSIEGDKLIKPKWDRILKEEVEKLIEQYKK